MTDFNAKFWFKTICQGLRVLQNRPNAWKLLYLTLCLLNTNNRIGQFNIDILISHTTRWQTNSKWTLWHVTKVPRDTSTLKTCILSYLCSLYGTLDCIWSFPHNIPLIPIQDSDPQLCAINNQSPSRKLKEICRRYLPCDLWLDVCQWQGVRWMLAAVERLVIDSYDSFLSIANWLSLWRVFFYKSIPGHVCGLINCCVWTDCVRTLHSLFRVWPIKW